MLFFNETHANNAEPDKTLHYGQILYCLLTTIMFDYKINESVKYNISNLQL